MRKGRGFGLSSLATPSWDTSSKTERGIAGSVGGNGPRANGLIGTYWGDVAAEVDWPTWTGGKWAEGQRPNGKLLGDLAAEADWPTWTDGSGSRANGLIGTYWGDVAAEGDWPTWTGWKWAKGQWANWSLLGWRGSRGGLANLDWWEMGRGPTELTCRLLGNMAGAKRN